jgi:rhomboid protease GluP
METRRMCPNCRAFITTRDRVCPYCEAQVGPRAADFRNPSDVAGLIPHARFTTVVILLINFGLYVATALFSIKQGNSDAWLGVDGLTLLRFGAKYTPIVFAGDWWRLVTAGFLHGGLLHILMNSWVLFDLGTQVEEFYGTARYLVFYVIATMGGFLASCYWNPAISIGASAGIFGLIGAMIAVGVTHQSSLGLAIRGLYIRWAIYGLIFGLLPGLAIDNAAHIGGLVAGFAVAYVAGLPRPGSLKDRFWGYAGWAAVLLTIYCFYQMYVTFSRSVQMMSID